MSQPLYENRPQLVVEQFRYRDIIDEVRAGPLPNPGPTTFFAGSISDVVIKYVTIQHNSGVGKNVGLEVTLDGSPIGDGEDFFLNNIQIYYIYIQPDGNTHNYTLDRTLYCADTTQYGHTFGNLRVWVGNPGVTDIRVRVRYDQL